MGLSLRKGKYGEYWGNDYNSSQSIGDAKRKVNAKYIYLFLTAKGWTINAISAILGNMQAESTINPGRWQSDRVGGDSSGHGYSLVQWTPYTKYTNWCESNGFSDPSEMDAALSRIVYEVANDTQWIGVGDYYGMSFKEFSESNLSVSYLAKAFLLCYERPADQSESVQNYRASLAESWYNYLISNISVDTNFTPRLSSTGIEGDKYWYSGNPFYQSGYGLPNCTCYAWGRFWEISDNADGVKDYSNKPTLPTSDAGNWFNNVTGYETGQTPKLGAVICWAGSPGHVAIVEEIKDNGDIVVSQSAWEGQYFWTDTAKKSNNYSLYGYTFQGFIYNPDVYNIIVNPDDTSKKKRRFNFILFNRRKMYG